MVSLLPSFMPAEPSPCLSPPVMDVTAAVPKSSSNRPLTLVCMSRTTSCMHAACCASYSQKRSATWPFHLFSATAMLSSGVELAAWVTDESSSSLPSLMSSS